MTYNEFIESIINTRGQWNIPRDEYFEVHHILPICLGGEPGWENMTQELKFSEHPNLIWLYPEEHYHAHVLLSDEHPDNYGLYAARIGASAHGAIGEADYGQLKRQYHKLPENILQIEEGVPFHYNSLKLPARKTTSDTSGYIKEQARRRELGLCCTRGKNNGMYGNGYKISGGRNGHASIRYFFKDKVFESRKELVEYLESIGIKITCSAIRVVVHKTGTMRVYNMYKDVFDNLTWEYKE